MQQAIKEGRFSKEHRLTELMNRCKRFTTEIFKAFPRDTPEEERLFKLLERAYVESRYNPDFEITKEDIDALLPKVERLRVSAGIFRSIVVEGRKPAEPERVAEAEASSIPSYEAFRVGPFVPDGPCFAGRSDRVKRTYCVKSRMNTYSSGIL